jgi:tripartite-type tricarboxylate transporter receptor subunit TctC
MIVHVLRRDFLTGVASAALLPAMGQAARAEIYPSRPVNLIVGTAPAGTPDIDARLIGQWLQEKLGQPFIVQNKPGAGTNLGTEMVVRSAPDGYTLLLITVANAINATLYGNMTFNFIDDIAPVAALVRTPLVMEVNPSLPVKTVAEFIAYTKANPGKVNMATSGNGTPQHIAAELFTMMAGIDVLHVPYRSTTPALVDLLAGQVQVIFDTIPASIEFIRAGKLRPLGVTTTAPLDVLPGIPTVAEAVPGYEASAWQGVGAPKGTSAEIVDLLNRQINAALADEKIKQRLIDLGAVPIPMSPSDFAKMIAVETEKFAKVIKFANIKLE